MSGDDDLAGLLPEAPPRPDRREAAIAEALRRFDGGEARPPIRRPIRWLLPVWPKLGRAQMGALMSMALVAVIGVPLALVALREERAQQLSREAPVSPAQAAPAVTLSVPEARAPKSQPPPAPAAAIQAPPPRPVQVQPQMAPPAAADAETSGSTANGLVPESDQAARAEPPAFMAQRQARAQGVAPALAPPVPLAPPPPPPPAGQFALRRGAFAEAPETRSRDDAAKASTAAKAVTQDRGRQEIVVTGSRIMSPAGAALARRGDWNACTVDDPGRSLEGCKRLVDPAARGDAGRAAARVADGLALAWGGDMDGAIAAFDVAIDIEPRLALAYLNRGLAYRREGEDARALADFDKAVRYAPLAARGYYHRSVALRRQGDARRAGADERRAVELDSRYEALFD